jgi:hypothetical protein
VIFGFIDQDIVTKKTNAESINSPAEMVVAFKPRFPVDEFTGAAAAEPYANPSPASCSDRRTKPEKGLISSAAAIEPSLPKHALFPRLPHGPFLHWAGSLLDQKDTHSLLTRANVVIDGVGGPVTTHAT